MAIDNVPQPFFTECRDWTDRMAPIILPYGDVYVLDSEENWKIWAAYVVNLPGFAILSPPNPAEFADWREWAQRFIEVLQ